MKVSSIVEDCNLDKGIIVTINEFTPDAVKYAKSKNIGLVQLRKPLPEDKINRVWDIHIDLSMNYFEHDVKPLVAARTIDPSLIPEIQGLGNPSDIIIYPEGNKISLLELLKIYTAELLKHKNGKMIVFPFGTILRAQGVDKPIPIVGIHVKTKINQKDVGAVILHGDDIIEMIMKSIFEHKYYIITKEGDIEEK